MLYAIHCLDRENALSIRLDNYDAHRDYLNSTQTNIVLAGPVTADDISTPIGSLMVISVVSLATGLILDNISVLQWEQKRLQYLSTEKFCNK